MPSYKNLSIRKLKEWGNGLVIIVQDLKDHPSKLAFELFILELYEYLFVWAAFGAKCNYYTSKKSESLTIKNITHSEEYKKYVSPLLILKDFADLIRHDNTRADIEFNIKIIFEDLNMHILWDKYLVDLDNVYSFVCNDWKYTYREIFNTKQLSNLILKDIKLMLRINPNTGFNSYSLNSIASKIQEKFHCSQQFSMSLVLSAVGNEYLSL